MDYVTVNQTDDDGGASVAPCTGADRGRKSHQVDGLSVDPVAAYACHNFEWTVQPPAHKAPPQKVPMALRTKSPRRSRLAALGAITAATLLTVTACSTPAGETAQEPTSATEDAAPATGGTLKVGFSDDVGNYDPHQRPQLTSRTISRQIADTLTDQDPATGEIVPFLATSWDISEDATAFTFTLREDVTFSDGTPLTAEVVKANLDRVVEIGPLAYIGAGLLRNYVGTEVVSDYVLTVTFSEPNAQFLQATSVASLSILAPATLEADPEAVAAGDVIGSGPYVLTSYDPNAGIVLTAREDYAWGSQLYENTGRAHFDTVEVSFIEEPVTLAGAVTSGQLDYAYILDAASVPTLEGAGAQVISTPMPAITIPIVPLLHREIWADENTRRALSFATDRETIVQTVYGGHFPAATGVLTTSNPGYVDLSSELTYDPDRAIALLVEAGWTETGDDGVRAKADGTRLSLEIQYTSTGTGELLLQLLQQQWAQVGIEFRLTPVADLSEYTLHTYPFDLTTWSQTRADADVLRTVYSSFYENQSFLYGHADEDVDALLGTLQSTVDPAERLKVSEEVQRLLIERGYTVPLYDRIQFAGASATVDGVATDIEGKPLFVDFYRAG